jgi:hypothetical protein
MNGATWVTGEWLNWTSMVKQWQKIIDNVFNISFAD